MHESPIASAVLIERDGRAEGLRAIVLERDFIIDSAHDGPLPRRRASLLAWRADSVNPSLRAGTQLLAAQGAESAAIDPDYRDGSDPAGDGLARSLLALLPAGDEVMLLGKRGTLRIDRMRGTDGGPCPELEAENARRVGGVGWIPIAVSCERAEYDVSFEAEAQEQFPVSDMQREGQLRQDARPGGMVHLAMEPQRVQGYRLTVRCDDHMPSAIAGCGTSSARMERWKRERR